MKKIFAIPMCMSLFLCGCSRETENDAEFHVDVDDTEYFETIPDFQATQFYQTMQEDGFTVYLPEYDTSKYTLVKGYAVRKAYTFVLKNNETDDALTYQIRYDTYMENAEEVSDNKLDKTGDICQTVEKDGENYDVYVSKTPYMSEPMYNISYLPFEKYLVSISPDSPTPEEALAYIHDFDLVPAENTAPTEKIFDNVVRTIEYQTIPEFLESEFCQTMQSEGFAVYLPSYDAAQYELQRITSDATFYEFSFIETATGKNVVYSVLYNTYFKSADEFAQLYPDTADENILTSVEKDGVSQDAYIVKTQLTEDSCCYNLSYLPMEGYEVYIGSNSDTPEDALAYIHDFDLVSANE